MCDYMGLLSLLCVSQYETGHLTPIDCSPWHLNFLRMSTVSNPSSLPGSFFTPIKHTRMVVRSGSRHASVLQGTKHV